MWIEEAVSRQEMAVFIDRFISYMNIELKDNSKVDAFGDKSKVTDYAKAAVETMRKSGIITGDQNGNFNPSKNLSRAESITDANGYTTKFSYDEDTIHIYDYNTYSVHGSEMLLTKIDLPTGGWSAYEYEKARRNYSYVFNSDTYSGWYEVYKVSKVSDSSGYERTYEYQNDRSGYPYENSVTNYSCIMKEDSKITVSTFNHQHNKVKEQTFDEGNTQNDYIVGNGQSKWRAVVGDYVYHMGYLDEDKYQTYFYKQNIQQ